MNKVAAKLAQQSSTTGAVAGKFGKTPKATPKMLYIEEPVRAKRPGLQTPNKTGASKLPRAGEASLFSSEVPKARPAAKTPSKSGAKLRK
jgi:hypothetical protein